MSILKRIASKILWKELRQLQAVVKTQEEQVDYWKGLHTQLRLSQPERKVVFRIPRHVFDTFRKGLPKMLIGSNTTDLQAAALVAQQHVINLIEEQLVDERS